MGLFVTNTWTTKNIITGIGEDSTNNNKSYLSFDIRFGNNIDVYNLGEEGILISFGFSDKIFNPVIIDDINAYLLSNKPSTTLSIPTLSQTDIDGIDIVVTTSPIQ